MTLPNPWNIFNLRASPYWQNPLGDGDDTHPLSLFVGRSQEMTALLNGLYGAGDGSSRRAVAGASGVGKTTLVKEFKARAQAAGYLTIDSFVPVVEKDTTESLFGRILSAIYDTVLANRPHTIQHPAMQAAQVLVRATRELTRGGGLSVLGVGASLSQGIASTAPKDVLIDGPRVLRDLMTLVRGSDAQGILLHINNLENLSDADAEHAGVILRDLRDIALMHSGLHVVLVGTSEAVQAAVLGLPQLRSIFSVLNLEPAPESDVFALLNARYAWQRLDPARPAIAPVEEAVISNLYGLFGGDLRGLLKALDDGVTPAIGLTPTTPIAGQSSASGAAPTLASADIFSNLQRRYAGELAALREERRIEQLVQWGSTDPSAAHTQKSLATMWKVSQPAVSQALGFLMRYGYVMSIPRRGLTPTQYVLTGASRLIFPVA